MLDLEESMIEDQFKYVDLVDEKYGGKDVKKFILGHSFGGLMGLKMSIKREKYFNGLGLLSPFIKFKHEDLVERNLSMSKMVTKVFPTLNLVNFPVKAKKVPRHLFHFATDKMMEFKRLSVHNLVTIN